MATDTAGSAGHDRVTDSAATGEVPDLDLCPTIWCPVGDCTGYACSDGTSWWCESCGATWDSNGERGEMSR